MVRYVGIILDALLSCHTSGGRSSKRIVATDRLHALGDIALKLDAPLLHHVQLTLLRIELRL